MTRRLLRLTLWLASSLVVLGFFALSVRILRDPQSGAPTEPAILAQAEHLANFRTPYPETTAGSGVALMPGFSVAVSGLVLMFGPQPWEPRLVGLLCTLLVAIVAGIVVHRETKTPTLGITSVAMLLMGQGFDVHAPAGGGPVSLLLLLVLISAVILRYAEGRAATIGAAVMFTAACFTHPAGLWFAFGALVYLAISDYKRFIPYAIALVVFIFAVQASLTWAMGPWFNFQAWDASIRQARFEPANLLNFMGTQLLGSLGMLAFATLLSFALPLEPWRGTASLWMWMWFAAIGAGIMATQSLNSGDALRPAAVVLAILGPISILRAALHLSAWPGATRTGGQAVALAALVLQFIMLVAHSTAALRAAV